MSHYHLTAKIDGKDENIVRKKKVHRSWPIIKKFKDQNHKCQKVQGLKT